MANEEQLSILRQGVEVWNKWREEHPELANAGNIDLIEANLKGADLSGVYLWNADLTEANLVEANLVGAKLSGATFRYADFRAANLRAANLSVTDLIGADFNGADLSEADLTGANLFGANLNYANLKAINLSSANMGLTLVGYVHLDETIGLGEVRHEGPSHISIDTFAYCKGKIPAVFLRGCGLSDWEIEMVKLYDPDLSNDKFIDIQNRVFDLRNRQALQISPLFISYSHADSEFVDKIGDHLTKKGIRYWRDIHEMKAGRMEKQVDRAIRQNPTVLLVLSEHSRSSDWVEHEVRTARGLEKEMGRDVLCPIALDDSWKSSPWPKRVMEQILEYNILDFEAWRDDQQFDGMFRKLINGLQLFYKG